MASGQPADDAPKIHEAELASGADGLDGLVEYEAGSTLTEDEAVQRRQQSLNIVVRGPNGRANKAVARRIEDRVGPAIHHAAHSGPKSLCHFQQKSGSPGGHSFYEDNGPVKAKRKQ